jgi:hypothetical protein
MRKDAVGRTCGTYEREKCMQNFSQQTTKKNPLGTSRRRVEDKITLREIEFEEVH